MRVVVGYDGCFEGTIVLGVLETVDHCFGGQTVAERVAP
jgi:hypothetical protein